jgi:hypothetical protein
MCTLECNSWFSLPFKMRANTNSHPQFYQWGRSLGVCWGVTTAFRVSICSYLLCSLSRISIILNPTRFMYKTAFLWGLLYGTDSISFKSILDYCFCIYFDTAMYVDYLMFSHLNPITNPTPLPNATLTIGATACNPNYRGSCVYPKYWGSCTQP